MFWGNRENILTVKISRSTCTIVFKLCVSKKEGTKEEERKKTNKNEIFTFGFSFSERIAELIEWIYQ